MEPIKVVGSGEAVLYLSRVPCIGERVVVNGLPRTVTAVEHHSVPPAGWPLAGAQPAGMVSWSGTIPSMVVPVAVVTVTDD